MQQLVSFAMRFLLTIEYASKKSYPVLLHFIVVSDTIGVVCCGCDLHAENALTISTEGR